MKATKIFLDTEFTHLAHDAELISIALVDEDYCTFYAEFNDYDDIKVSDFTNEYVLPYLVYQDKEVYFRRSVRTKSNSLDPSKVNVDFRMKDNKEVIKQKLQEWLSFYHKIELWGDYPMYDWMLLSDLMDKDIFKALPNLSNIIYDINTINKVVDMLELENEFQYKVHKEQPKNRHNSHDDAIFSLIKYNHLIESLKQYKNE